MAGSTYPASHRSLLLPLRLLLLAAAVSGATGSYEPKAFCFKTTDVASCLRVFPTLPDDVAKSQDNEQLYTGLYDYSGDKIYEATSLAESMIATTTAADPVIIATFFPQWKGDEAITTKTPPGKCLLSCNKTIGDIDAIQTCGHTYMEDRPPMIHQNLTVLFHGGHPLPFCKSGCPDRSSSEGEAILATKFKYIWSLLDLMEAVLPEYLSETGTRTEMTTTNMSSGAKHKTTIPSPDITAAATTAP
uniref:Pectinesterase inhibitor domain-containing protein n=1 Tax=Oryza punctata TaxID=4537 RepID=A0A0E0MDD1_ORYPU